MFCDHHCGKQNNQDEVNQPGFLFHSIPFFLILHTAALAAQYSRKMIVSIISVIVMDS
jgi:hypothetical protein